MGAHFSNKALAREKEKGIFHSIVDKEEYRQLWVTWKIKDKIFSSLHFPPGKLLFLLQGPA
jgi:hypothetical protein